MPHPDANVPRAVELVRARAAFRRAHRRALLRTLFGRLRGRPNELCSFERAKPAGGVVVAGARRRTDVPLERIHGSVDRSGDYTADFLPRHGRDEERWARVWTAIGGERGVPPLELIELDGDYFVEDGHHRVSVLRRMGARCAEAYVTRLRGVARSRPDAQTDAPAPARPPAEPCGCAA